MATKNQKTTLEENPNKTEPSDHELFAGEVHEELSEHEVFAGRVHEELSEREVFVGDEDFYKRLADSAQADTAQSRLQRAWTGANRPLLTPTGHKRFSTIQKVLVVSIAVIVAVLVYELFPPAPPPASQPTHSPKLPAEDTTSRLTAPGQQIQKPSHPDLVDVETPTQPLSLKVAETFYTQKDYDKAYAAYNQLRESIPAPVMSIGIEGELLSDFLQLKMALCMKKTADTDQAGRLFRTVSKSRSPVVRVVANYHLGYAEMQKGQYLKALTRAYQALALIGAVDFNRNRALSLQRDCHFWIAESITRNVLSLCDADKNLPDDLWSNPAMQTDPFTNLSEAQLRSFLNSGSEKLSKGLLGPQIQKVTGIGSSEPPRWSVTCHGAPIEELMARFSTNAGLDVSWAFGRVPESEEIRDTTRKRPVSLYLPATTPRQFVSAAAGCAGLLARLDDNHGTPVVNIFNPADYSSLSEHVSLLSQEAISLWQRFLLTFHGDERIPNAHFALGLLQAQEGNVADATAEYKLVANRFSQSSLAPFALLHSSKLKAGLRDYFGARQDLKQLAEQYPDSEVADQACLYLADATMKAQLYDEAARLYRKVYNLDSSLESQTVSAIGAARCFYERKDYQSAAKWLTRYIGLAGDSASKELYSAYFLLGKTNLALEKPEAACDAFQYALAGQLSREEYAETVSALVKGHIQQKHFIEALDILENIHSWRLSQKESIDMLLLRSQTLQAMGLVDKAIAALGDRAEYISDPQLKAEISFELAKCHITKGNLELARSNLTEILILVEPGPLSHKAACELADVCLKLGQNSQTISVCSQLLNLDPSAQIKQKTLNILAAAYSRQKNYDRAVLALSGRWNTTETQ
jgi:tetratricopeptide (TPR) repeat protein